MAKTSEPDFVKFASPEETLRQAVMSEITELLSSKKNAHEEKPLEEFFVLTNFGLDIAVFMKWPVSSEVRLLEIKAFVGSRQGGVGIGNQKGHGNQIDLLLLPGRHLALADQLARWILGDGTRPKGSPRYVIFSNTKARDSAMGGVRRGKQNNLRVSSLFENGLTWDELSGRLDSFLLGNHTSS